MGASHYWEGGGMLVTLVTPVWEGGGTLVTLDTLVTRLSSCDPALLNWMCLESRPPAPPSPTRSCSKGDGSSARHCPPLAQRATGSPPKCGSIVRSCCRHGGQPAGVGGGGVPGLPAELRTCTSTQHEQRGGERACRQLQLQTRTPPHTPTGSWGGAYLWHILDTHQLNPQ